MVQTTPSVRGDTLSYQQEGHEQTLVVGSAAWYAWLRMATVFAFRSDSSTFQVRKEQAGNKRGGGTGEPTTSGTASSVASI